MEWMLSVNDMLHDEITKITNSLIPPGFEGDVRSIRRMQDSLARVVDQLGEMSAAEQGLSKVITSTVKLRSADNQTIYILKDAQANNGAGEAVGLLKVGPKHLFLFDERQTVREVEPLCVLDFFVRHGRQRRGLGRRLFDHMLRDQACSPHRLAVDGPSATMECFLARNYNITRLLRQNNNFAVSPRFFDDLAAPARAASHGMAPPTPAPPTPAVGRYTARQPASSMASVIHGVGGATSRDSSETRARAASAAATPAPSPSPAAEAARGGDGAAPPPPVPRPSSLAVAPSPVPPAAAASAPPLTPPAAGAAPRRDSQLTEQGYFDVKFYHMKLW